MAVAVALVAAALLVDRCWRALAPSIAVAPPPSAADPNERLWSFGFVGDTHQGMNDSVVAEIFGRFESAGVEFVLHLGDMVDDGESEQAWQSLISLANAHRLRLLPVVGNHDVLPAYRDRGDIRFRRHFPWLPATFYHFRHRGINFLMLNSELSLLPGSRQRHFLAAQLNKHPGTTVVCLHRPVFTCGNRDWANKYWRQLWLHRAIASTDVRLVLAGHNHYYERSHRLDGITYVTSGGGTTNTYAAERADRRTACFVAGTPHYGIAEVGAERIMIRIVALDGKELDRFAVELRRPHRQPGHQRNRLAIELPPVESLPAFGANARQEIADQMPRPW
jgi:predicted phosphodiesterase